MVTIASLSRASSSDWLIRHNRIHCVPRDTRGALTVATICLRPYLGLARRLGVVPVWKR
jgi:hypothetical protein